MSEHWRSIPCRTSELRLDITLVCGQSFRWKEIQPGTWRSVLGGCIWTLKQTDSHILYQVHDPKVHDTDTSCDQIGGSADEESQMLTGSSPRRSKRSSDQSQEDVEKKKQRIDSNASGDRDCDASVLVATAIATLQESMYETTLRDYFQLDVDLEKLYEEWKSADANFARVSDNFPGVRILRQHPVENLMSFICSSNNNISRISALVEKLCLHFGEEVGTVDGEQWHAFPTLVSLSEEGVEEKLRQLGFGYRSKFICEAARMVSTHFGGEDWLWNLRTVPYAEAHAELVKLQGVGPKVADCVCLMSLDKSAAIPVDTHVWQIASRDYMPGLTKTKSLTDRIYREIANHFRQLFGDYAGWAHSVLFSADLKKFQETAKVKSPTGKEKKYRPQGYRQDWELESWAEGWLSASKYYPGKAYCSFCNKDLAPGKSELVGHAKTSYHVERSKLCRSNHPTSSFTLSKRSTTVEAELNLVALIARNNLSLDFLDPLMETLRHIGGDSRSIKDITCNRAKATCLLTECLSQYAHEQLVTDLKLSSGFSILCDKATDSSMNEVFCVHVRFLNAKGVPVTRLYRLIPVEAVDASDLFASLESTLQKDGLNWDDIVGYASDGDNLMQGANNAFLARMATAAPNIFVLQCYCHTFHLVAERASKLLSKAADQLIQDVYSYFKMQQSCSEFQKFVEADVHQILKPCQTSWLSAAQCVSLILDHWPALELFFTAEANDSTSLQAMRIIQALKSPFVKATLEFCEYVLGELSRLNVIFQSKDFQLHHLVTEVGRVVQFLCRNFRNPIQDLSDINVDDDTQWLPIEKVNPGTKARETMGLLLPHEREGFLRRCRDWCREAVRQIVQRIDLCSPVLNALNDVNHVKVLDGSVDVRSAGILAQAFPRISSSIEQSVDRQWRNLLADRRVRKGGWENKGIVQFWQSVSRLREYEDLAVFMLQMISLPQSTAEVDRAFTKLNANRTKLRNSLALNTLEAVIKTAETFPSEVNVDERLTQLYSNAKDVYLEKYLGDEQLSVDPVEDFA